MEIKVTSLQVAGQLKRIHKNIIQLIRQYEKDFEELGELEIIKESTRGRPSVHYVFNLNQIKFLISLMHGKDIAKLKKQIILNSFNSDDFLNFKTGGYFTSIYLVKNNSGLYKIGVSKNPEQRIRNISTQTGQKIETIHISDLMDNGNNVESRIHHLYSDKRHLGEWFTLTNNDIDNIKNKIIEYSKTSKPQIS